MAGNSTTIDARLPLEPPGQDFPYYHDDPPVISMGGWLLVLAGPVAGFAALDMPLPFADDMVSGWLRAIAFVGLPLIALAIAARGRWLAIFGRVGFREVKLMVIFAFLNIVVSMAIGTLVNLLGTAKANTAIADSANLDGPHLLSFFAKVAVQLLGEELITILPFLAVLALCFTRIGLDRNISVIIAWLLSAVAFALAHLPTYDWNIVQCLVVIGSARLVLSWAYVWTKNIWVSTGAHIINDWSIIALTVVLAPLATSS